MARAGKNATAVNRTLKELRDDGRFEQVAPAVVELCKSLANAVDADPTNAALWREYRAALDDLREAASVATDDDAAEFRIKIQAPRGRAAMVDSEDA